MISFFKLSINPISLSGEILNNMLDFIDLKLIPMSFSLESRDLRFKFVYLLMCQVLFFLKLLAKLQLLVQVIL